MTIEFRYAKLGEYHRISAFIDAYWAKDHVYVRMPQLFEWTFRRCHLWDQEGYSFVLAEHRGEIVGILGGIPFLFNRLGHTALAVWLVNYLVRPDYRQRPIAFRFPGMFRRAPYEVNIAFGLNPRVVPVYRGLRWQVLSNTPRHFVVLPNAVGRMVNLLHLAYPDWPPERAERLARSSRLPDPPQALSQCMMKTLPSRWNDDDWPYIASQTVGAARDLDYLTWRYLEHPCFNYRFIAVPEGNRHGLAVWRLETIQRTTPQGLKKVDRIGRLVEFLPASRANAKDLLVHFWHELDNADAMGADYYGYHGEISVWLRESGFHGVEDLLDGEAIPSRFQPLDGKGGRLMSAVWTQDDTPVCSLDRQCAWYWTKSDSDQDRPN